MSYLRQNSFMACTAVSSFSFLANLPSVNALSLTTGRLHLFSNFGSKCLRSYGNVKHARENLNSQSKSLIWFLIQLYVCPHVTCEYEM